MLVIYEFIGYSVFFSALERVYQDYLLQLHMVVMISILLPFVRRLHDIGLSDWFVLLFLLDFIVPPLGTLAIFIMACMDSKPGENCWGKCEKYHYYYFINDEKKGPFSLVDIYRHIDAGDLTEKTPVWSELTAQPVPFKQLTRYFIPLQPVPHRRDNYISY